MLKMRNIKIIGLVAFVGLFLSGCQSKETTMKQDNQSQAVEVTSQKETSSQSVTDQSTKVSDSLEGTATSQTEEIAYETFAPTTLITAVQEQNIEQVKKIMKDPQYVIDETNSEGNTPLNIAVHQNQVEIAKILIDHGADINIQNNISDSPYLYAGAEGRSEILTYMLTKQKPDYQKVNRYGGNALIPAAEKGHIENVKILLGEEQMAVDFQNNFGYTALIEAVALNDGSETYQEITRLLIAGGADKSIRDNSGRTALDYAKERNFKQIIDLLK